MKDVATGNYFYEVVGRNTIPSINFVIAENGKEFEVDVTVTIPCPGSTYKCYLYLDGRYVQGHMKSNAEREWVITFKGWDDSASIKLTRMRFQLPEIDTEEDAANNLSSFLSASLAATTDRGFKGLSVECNSDWQEGSVPWCGTTQHSRFRFSQEL